MSNVGVSASLSDRWTSLLHRISALEGGQSSTSASSLSLSTSSSPSSSPTITRNSSTASSSSSSSSPLVSTNPIPSVPVSASHLGITTVKGSPLSLPFDGEPLREDFLLQMYLMLSTHAPQTQPTVKPSPPAAAATAPPQPPQSNPEDLAVIQKLRDELKTVKSTLADAQAELNRLRRQAEEMKTLNEQTKIIKEERDDLKYEVVSLKLDVDIERKQKIAAEQKAADLKQHIDTLAATPAPAPPDTPTKENSGFFKRIGSLGFGRRGSDPRIAKPAKTTSPLRRPPAEEVTAPVEAEGDVSALMGSPMKSAVNNLKLEERGEGFESPSKRARAKKIPHSNSNDSNDEAEKVSLSASTTAVPSSPLQSRASALWKSLNFSKLKEKDSKDPGSPAFPRSNSADPKVVESSQEKDESSRDSPRKDSSGKAASRHRFFSAGAGKPPIVPAEPLLKTRKTSLTKIEVQFPVVGGIKRGACDTPGCTCPLFSKKESGLACKNCSHFAIAHADKGRPEDDAKSLAPQSPRRSEVRVLERVLSISASDYTKQTKTQLLEKLEDQWLLEYAEFFFVDQLGKGNSSTVFKGTYKTKDVALKVLRLENHKRDLDDFKKELEIMSQVRDPHIVHFYGATIEPKLVICLEYCTQGSLFHYLQNTANEITWPLIFRWTKEMAHGLDALHSFKTPIVHRDFKSLNLLLDSNLAIKVCDFGLSRFVQSEAPETLFKLRGTYAYIGPEVYNGEPFSVAADVYSIAIVIWEMVYRLLVGRHNRPYHEYPALQHDFQIIVQAAKGVRPIIPDNCPQLMIEFITSLWHPEPTSRPTCKALTQRVVELEKIYEENKDDWDRVVARADANAAPVSTDGE